MKDGRFIENLSWKDMQDMNKLIPLNTPICLDDLREIFSQEEKEEDENEHK